MARVTIGKKYCTVNPLKMSPSIGAALAFMGVDNSMPLLHGSQGCTSFGLVLFVRHFREAIPMQTTAMSEVATVLGGFDNLEQALMNIAGRTKPALIGICTTGISEIPVVQIPINVGWVRSAILTNACSKFSRPPKTVATSLIAVVCIGIASRKWRTNKTSPKEVQPCEP